MTSQSIFSKFHLRASVMPKLLAAAAVLGLSLSAHASNIVVDGGFESAAFNINGYAAGQSIDGGSWNVTAGDVFIDSGDPYVYAGNNSLNLTGINPYTTNSVSQTLSTIAGKSYVLNFWANSDSDNAFSTLINGVALAGSPANIANNGFTDPTNNSSLFVDYSEAFTATSNTTTLTFSDVANPPITFPPSGLGSVMIDNVSVQLTPEPGSVVLLATGIFALGLVAMRKRLAQTFIAG